MRSEGDTQKIALVTGTGGKTFFGFEMCSGYKYLGGRFFDRKIMAKQFLGVNKNCTLTFLILCVLKQV